MSSSSSSGNKPESKLQSAAPPSTTMQFPKDLDLEQQAAETVYGDDWTNTAQDKLETWRNEAMVLSEKHDHARSIFTGTRDRLNLPVIVFSAATTVLVSQNASGEPNMAINLAALVLSGLTTVISGFNAFYAPSERVANHIKSSNAYGSLARMIDYTINLPPHKRPDVEVAYVQVTSMLDAIGGSAPPLPRKLHK